MDGFSFWSSCLLTRFISVLGSIDDALLVPVSVSYERVLEGGFLEERMGESKQRESLWAVAKSTWNAFGGRYGFVRLDFGSPVSLKVRTGLDSWR